MKKNIILMIWVFTFVLICSCEKDPCTKTIDTFNGPQEIEVDCAFAD